MLLLRVLILILDTIEAFIGLCKTSRFWLIGTLLPRLDRHLPASLDTVTYRLIKLAVDILFLVSGSLHWLFYFSLVVARFWILLGVIIIRLSWKTLRFDSSFGGQNLLCVFLGL